MRTAVITGAAGFLGSHLARALVEKGRKVVGVDNLSPGTVSGRRQSARVKKRCGGA